MTPEEQALALTRDAWKVVDGLVATFDAGGSFQELVRFARRIQGERRRMGTRMAAAGNGKEMR